ncbi:MAG: hypothetical protein H0T62_12455 [Parachlamydiaceae bacterium]|nr:hypothetical protein [Parachlamydiaceae bacterium]
MHAVQQGLSSQGTLICPSEKKIFKFLTKDCLTHSIAHEILRKVANRFAFSYFTPWGEEIKKTGGRLKIEILELNKINYALKFCAEGGQPMVSRENLEMTITQNEINEITKTDEENSKKWEQDTKEPLKKKNKNFIYTPSAWDKSSLPYMPMDYPFDKSLGRYPNSDEL